LVQSWCIFLKHKIENLIHFRVGLFQVLKGYFVMIVVATKECSGRWGLRPLCSIYEICIGTNRIDD